MTGSVHHAWLLNPIERTLEVLRLRDGTCSIAAVHTGGERLTAVGPALAVAGGSFGMSVATR